MNNKKIIKMNDNTKIIKTIYVGMTPNGEVRYTYKSKDGMKYTTPELMVSKKNKLYCPWIRVYDPNTKQSVLIKYKEPRYYRVSAFFIQHIPLLKEQEQYILEQGLYILEY
jgi:hypothetical protein